MSKAVVWDPGRVSKRNRLEAIMKLIRIEHTLFSLPFAYAGAVLAYPRGLGLWEAIWIGLAVLGLRSAAMSFNNIADLDIDRLNPRTAKRPLVTEAVRLRDAWLVVVVGSLLYYLSAAMLNIYALILSPLLWILAMTYPYAKRVHWLPHLHLGLVLGFVVFGGAVAVYGSHAKSLMDVLTHIPWIYVVAVTLWVAGFDAYYAIMDEDFDRKMGLGSLAARFGAGGALLASRIIHGITALLLLISIPVYGLGPIGALGVIMGIALLLYQHYILYRDGLQAIPRAFNTNLLLGIVIGLGVFLDKLIYLYAH
ncbi:putative 4-hydroxybenzoate polyprenyltransferase [Pyrofollis japonicus]|uniref:UbiA-like polyprenyltransferase n=1 Tax=Pyrofollis japonicus TaxID=3060460 RepID=UPI00295B8E48|nr:UbiA-like polyprenyltransferase [Pyrofollis japonicus]BEP17489.1 putative 4-hydroxybenzoate polyprenyltransferase [Pyrofollis japonicus]